MHAFRRISQATDPSPYPVNASGDVLNDFMDTTEPAEVDAGRWGKRLRSGGQVV